MQHKPTYAVIILLLFSFIANAQSINPYKDIDKKQETVTLTKGEYEEVFDEDSIQRIGSALVNIHTMKVVGVNITKQEQRQLDNARESRFLSVDPLASSFAWNSPYSFAENDVMRCIDLDGKERFFIEDGNTPGTVIIQLVNYDKRPEAFIGNPRMPGTFIVEDKRKGATYKTEMYYFPIDAVQALYGGTFINDAGVVNQMGDARKAKVAQEELGIDPKSEGYSKPAPIKMDAMNGATQERQVLYTAEFPGGGKETTGKPAYKLVESSAMAINPVDTKSNDFGKGKSSYTENYTAPKSDAPVKVSLLLDDGGSYPNSFTVMDSEGNTLASFKSTDDNHSTVVNFSVSAGSNFTVKVIGDSMNKQDNYQISGTARTTTTITYLAPDTDAK